MTVRLASALSDQPPSWSAEHLYFPLSLGTSLLITILPFANTETRRSCLIGSPPLSHDIFDGGFEVALQFSIALSSSFSVWLWGLTVIWGCSENNVTSMFLREIDQVNRKLVFCLIRNTILLKSIQKHHRRVPHYMYIIIRASDILCDHRAANFK